jgi:hypothetical protein
MVGNAERDGWCGSQHFMDAAEIIMRKLASSASSTERNRGSGISFQRAGRWLAGLVF